MIDVELFDDADALPVDAPSAAELRRLCVESAARMGVEDGHVAIEFVNAARITQLNAEHRGRARPTDVLSFPIDGVEPLGAPTMPPLKLATAAGRRPDGPPPRELGDIVICPRHTSDLREAVVHGMLHLLGMDHETDGGEMLALQRGLLIGVPR
jgi:probable rRNA maturation factor